MESNRVSYFSIHAMVLQYFKNIGQMVFKGEIFNFSRKLNGHGNISRYKELPQRSMKKKFKKVQIPSFGGTIPGHQRFRISERAQRGIRVVDGVFQHRGRLGHGEVARSSKVVSQETTRSLMNAILSNHQNSWKSSYRLEFIIKDRTGIPDTFTKPTLHATPAIGNRGFNLRKQTKEQDRQQGKLRNGLHSNLEGKSPIGDEEARKLIVGKFGSPTIGMKSEQDAAHRFQQNVKKGAKEKPWEGGPLQGDNVNPSFLERRIYPDKITLLKASNSRRFLLKRGMTETNCTSMPYESLNTISLDTVSTREQFVRRVFLPFILSKKKTFNATLAENLGKRRVLTRFAGDGEIYVNGKQDSKRMIFFLKEKIGFPGTIGPPKFQNWKSPKMITEGKEPSFETPNDLTYIPHQNKTFQVRVGSDVKTIPSEKEGFNNFDMGKDLISLKPETNNSTSVTRDNTPLSRTAVQQISDKVYHLLLDRLKRERELWGRKI